MSYFSHFCKGFVIVFFDTSLYNSCLWATFHESCPREKIFVTNKERLHNETQECCCCCRCFGTGCWYDRLRRFCFFHHRFFRCRAGSRYPERQRCYRRFYFHESSEAASSEAEVESAEYTVYNTTGENVTELYLYVAGSEDKGENLAADGLADGDSVVLTLPEDADKSAEYVLEFTTESGDTQSFDTLSYEVAPISLLSVDAAAGATPISFTAPEQ